MSGTGPLILIVEPQLDFADEARALLNGHRVVTARSMAEAAEIAEGGRVDLAVLGPSFGNETGVHGVDRLLAADPALAVILVAEVLTNRVLRAALRMGLRDVVEAPLTPSKVATMVGGGHASFESVRAGRATAPGSDQPTVGTADDGAIVTISFTDGAGAPLPGLTFRGAVPAPAFPSTITLSGPAFDSMTATGVEVLAGGSVTGFLAPDDPLPEPEALSPSPQPQVSAPAPEPEAAPAPSVTGQAPLPPDPAPSVAEQALPPSVPAPLAPAPPPSGPPPPAAPPPVAPAPAVQVEAPPPAAVPAASVAAQPPPWPPQDHRDLLADIDGPAEQRVFVPSRVPAPAAPLRPRSAGTGTVITIMAGKGGSGKTVAATNLATALTGTLGGDKVVILDADLQFGDVALLLQLDPSRTILDAAEAIEDLTEPRLDSLLLRHETGLRVLSAPLAPVSSERVPPKTVVRLMEMLKGMYQYVIVDTAPIFDDALMTVLDHSDEVVLVVDMDLPSVKNAKIALDTLRSTGYPLRRVHLVVNRVNSKARLDLVELERALGMEVVASVPSDRLVPQSVNEGIPAVAMSPRSKVAKAFEALADLFLP